MRDIMQYIIIKSLNQLIHNIITVLKVGLGDVNELDQLKQKIQKNLIYKIIKKKQKVIKLFK